MPSPRVRTKPPGTRENRTEVRSWGIRSRQTAWRRWTSSEECRQNLEDGVTAENVAYARKVLGEVQTRLENGSLTLKQGGQKSTQILAQLNTLEGAIVASEKILVVEQQDRLKKEEEWQREKEKRAQEKELQRIRETAEGAYNTELQNLETRLSSAERREDQEDLVKYSEALDRLKENGVQPFIDERLRWATEAREEQRKEEEKAHKIAAVLTPVPLIFTDVEGEKAEKARRNLWEVANLSGGWVDNSGKTDLTEANEVVDALLKSAYDVFYSKDIGRTVRGLIPHVVKAASDAGYDVDNNAVQQALVQLAIIVGSEKSETTMGSHSHLSVAGGGHYGYDEYTNDRKPPREKQ